MPPSLPLKSYEGTYYDPGYESLTFVLKDNILTADLKRTWLDLLYLEHVSGEQFFVAGYHNETYQNQLSRAEYHVDNYAGIATRVGVMFSQVKKYEMVWFDRV